MAEVAMDFRVRAIDEASNVFPRIAQAARENAAKVEEAGGIESLKAAFGRTSGLTETLHILSGAGPIIGLGIAARELGEFAEKLGDVGKEIRGDFGFWEKAGDFSLGLAKSVPLLGDIITAGQNIRAATTSEREEIDSINDAARLQIEYSRAHVRSALDLRDAYAEVAITVRKIVEDTARIGLQGTAGSFSATQQELTNRISELGSVRSGGGPPEMLEKIRAASTEHEDELEKLRAAQKETKRIFEAHTAIGQAPDIANYTPDVQRTEPAEIKEKRVGEAAQYKQLGDQIASLEKDTQDKVKQIRTQYLEEDKALVAKDQAELLDIQRQYSLEVIKQVDETQRKINDVRVQAQAQALRTSGQNYAADLLLIQQSLKDENLAVDRALGERMKEIGQAQKAGLLSDNQAQSEGQTAQLLANQEKQANAAKANADAAEAAKNDALQQEQTEQRIADIRTGAMMSALDLGGKAMEFERENLRITQEYAEKRREVTELMKTATEAQREQLGLTLQQLSAEEHVAHEVQVQKTLKDALQAPVEAAAAAGNKIAEMMVQTSKIQEEFSDRARALNDIIKDQSASAKDKSLAQGALSQLPAEQQKAIMRARQQIFPFISPTTSGNYFESVGNNATSGLAQNETERAFVNYQHGRAMTPEEVSQFHTGDQLQRDMIKLQDDIYKNTTELVKLVAALVARGGGGGQGGKPIFDTH